MQEIKDYIETYSLKELARIENHHQLTIRRWNRYIKVKIENWSTRAMFKQWVTKKPYTFKYIKLDDVIELLSSKWIKIKIN